MGNLKEITDDEFETEVVNAEPQTSTTRDVNIFLTFVSDQDKASHT